MIVVLDELYNLNDCNHENKSGRDPQLVNSTVQTEQECHNHTRTPTHQVRPTHTKGPVCMDPTPIMRVGVWM